MPCWTGRSSAWMKTEHSQFNELLFRGATSRFCVFDLLWPNGRDLRDLPLIERKRSLRKLIPPGCDSVAPA